jgi:hypothetical protein
LKKSLTKIKPIGMTTPLSPTLLPVTALDTSENPFDFIIAKAKAHDVVLLGTKHRQPPILDFISELLPNLPAAGITHIGLEIATDQQESIDRFIETGQGLNAIEIDPIIDCPDYRRNLVIIRTLAVKVVALDLPKSMWNSKHSRDRWMTNNINSILD